MSTTHPIRYSFEKVIRINDNLLPFEKSSFVIEAPIAVGGSNCSIAIFNKDKSEKLFESLLYIDYKTKSVKNQNSHEDPLIEDSGFNLICFQAPLQLKNKRDLLVEIQSEGKTIFEYLLDNDILNAIEDKKFSEIILDKNEILSHEPCELTLHLTDLMGNYKEQVIENYDFRKPFNYSDLIGKFNYIGLQFSYPSKLLETEEKYILVGQKSMPFSFIYETNLKEEIFPVIYNNKKFMPKASKGQLKEVININNLIHLMEIEKPYLFDISYDYIKQSYLQQPTYNQNKLYSSKKPNNIRSHLNLGVCKNCSLKSYCLQIVPSGLTEELFKKNIGIENSTSCKIYKIINKAVKY